jgi:hypothetical protein
LERATGIEPAQSVWKTQSEALVGPVFGGWERV